MTNLNIENRLARHPFLRGVSGPNILLLAEDTVPMVFQPGESIFRQGQKAQYLFLIEKGTAAVGLFKKDKWGPVTITHLGKGGTWDGPGPSRPTGGNSTPMR